MQLLSSIADLKDIVNKEYIDSILADYVLSANLGALATKDSLAFSDLTSRPSKLSDFTDDVVAGKYLPLSGGTITCTAEEALHIHRENGYVGIKFSNGAVGDGWVGYSNYGAYIYTNGHYLHVTLDGKPCYDNKILIHSGNVGDYALPSSGGTISGLLTLEPQNYHVIDIVSPDPNLAQITMSTNDILRGILQYNSNYGFGFHHLGLGGMYVNLGGEPNFVDSANNKHTLIHSGNYSSYALPLSGGTISGDTDALKILRNTNGYSAITYYNTQNGATTLLGVMGFDSNGEPSAYRASDNAWRTLIHSGNIGEYNAGSADVIATTYANQSINIGAESRVRLVSLSASNSIELGAPMQYVSGLSVMSNYVGWQLVSGASSWDNDDFFIRKLADNGNYLDWRQLAFTDSNVASATRAKYIETLNYTGAGWYGDSYKLYAKWFNGTICDWKSTDDANNEYKVRVDIAKKLDTARTLWGQSFDGTGDVSGELHLFTSKLYWNNDNVHYSIGCNGSVDTSMDLQAYGGIRFRTDENQIRMHINNSGNVTIGASDLAGTTRKLYVNGSLTATKGKFGNIHVNEGSGTNVGDSTIETSNKGMLYINYYHNGGLNLCQGGGNVGIGTTHPAYKLDVNGNIGTSGEVFLNHNKAIRMKGSNGTDYNVLFTSGTDLNIGYDSPVIRFGGSKMFINSSGYVGIGTTDPKYTLDVNGQLSTPYYLSFRNASDSEFSYIGRGGSAATLTIMTYGAGNPLNFGTNSKTRMYINGDGNVGIGTNNPAYNLDVAGSIRTTSSLTIGTIVLTDENGTLKIAGNAYTTGQLGAGEAGQPTSGGGSFQYWSNEYDMDIGTDVLVSSKEYIGTNTIVGWDLAGSCLNDLYIGYDGYTIWMQGSVDEASDMRLKTVIDAVNLDIRDIAYAPIFNYIFKSRPQGRQMLGSSAQYWQTIAPKAVSENDKGNLAMNYGAIALASVVAVAKKVVTHEEEIAELKSKVQSLETRLAKYELN